MEIPWHDYTNNDSDVLICKAGLIEKASVIGRVGLIMLSCGTGAWIRLKKFIPCILLPPWVLLRHLPAVASPFSWVAESLK